MNRFGYLFGLLVALSLVAGCGPSEVGAEIPTRSEPTEQELESMPPEARSAAQNAARAGNAQAQRMEQMAEAQRRAQSGQ